MTDYTGLVKALRGKFIAYDVTGNHNSAQLYKDAADAIEKLVALYEKAEMDATNLTGKLTQAEAQLPKRGEIVLCKECIHFTQGGWCDREFDWFPVDENDFCSMAEKMEGQE